MQWLCRTVGDGELKKKCWSQKINPVFFLSCTFTFRNKPKWIGSNSSIWNKQIKTRLILKIVNSLANDVDIDLWKEYNFGHVTNKSFICPSTDLKRSTLIATGQSHYFKWRHKRELTAWEFSEICVEWYEPSLYRHFRLYFGKNSSCLINICCLCINV